LLLAFVLFETQRGHLSPAEWFTDSRESIPARWLLGGLRPSRSVFYRFPGHLPEGLLDDLNRQILLPACSEGYTTARHGALDGTFTAACGSRHRLLTSSALDHRLQLLYSAIAADGNAVAHADPPATVPPAPVGQPPQPGPAAPIEPSPGRPGQPEAMPQQSTGATGQTVGTPAEPAGLAQPYWMAGTAGGRLRQHKAYLRAQQTLKRWQSEHDHKQKDKAKSRRRSAEDLVICPTEPEAVLGRDKCKVFRPLYNSQVMQVTDSGLLPPMLLRTEQLTGRKLAKVTTDGIYARLKDVRYCKDHGVQLYAPVGSAGKGSSKKRQRPGKAKAGKGGGKKEKMFGKEEFTW
jgi:hypothetical protein